MMDTEKYDSTIGAYRIVFPQNDHSCLTVRYVRSLEPKSEDEMQVLFSIASRKSFDNWQDAIDYGRELSEEHRILFKVSPDKDGYMD